MASGHGKRLYRQTNNSERFEGGGTHKKNREKLQKKRKYNWVKCKIETWETGGNRVGAKEEEFVSQGKQGKRKKREGGKYQ